MRTVLIVHDPSGGGDILLDNQPPEFEVSRVQSTEEAGNFFNGEARASMMVVGSVPDARELILRVKREFPTVRVIGIKEHRAAIIDCGCSCFTPQAQLSRTVQAFIGQPS